MLWLPLPCEPLEDDPPLPELLCPLPELLGALLPEPFDCEPLGPLLAGPLLGPGLDEPPPEPAGFEPAGGEALDGEPLP